MWKALSQRRSTFSTPSTVLQISFKPLYPRIFCHSTTFPPLTVLQRRLSVLPTSRTKEYENVSYCTANFAMFICYSSLSLWVKDHSLQPRVNEVFESMRSCSRYAKLPLPLRVRALARLSLVVFISYELVQEH